MGSLAVARALGDCSLKHTPKRILIPDPEVTTFKYHPQDEFIVIATDGLWDVMASQDAVTYVREQLSARNIEPGSSILAVLENNCIDVMCRLSGGQISGGNSSGA